MGSRRQSRISALKILYIMDSCRLSYEDAAAMVWHASDELPKIREFSAELASGVSVNLPRIDSLIVKYAENWELNRMAVIDRNILRLSAYELIWCKDTPISVIIDEAVEIAKGYSTADSGKFVNGILDKIKEERTDNTDIH